MKNQDRWRKILHGKNFKEGDFVKFKWIDLRKGHRGKLRKTWCYGVVVSILSAEGDKYWIRILEGSPCRALHAQGDVRPWYPRKSHKGVSPA